jgi:hypothetical protein
MPHVPTNPRRAALLAVLLAICAVIVGMLQAPTESVPAPRSPPASSVMADAPSATGGGPPDSPAAPEERHGPTKREGVDAANLYADALVLFAQLTDAEKAMIRKPGEEVDAEQAAKLFEKIQAIMALLRAAAKADYCDWGTGEITFETRLPHVSKARDLAKLALWAAGYRFSTDPAGAIDDLAVRAKLGHHLSDTLIGVLVAASIEREANGLLQQHAGSMDATTLDAAASFVGASTLDAGLARAMLSEMSAVQSMAKKFPAMNDDERIHLLLGFSAGDTPTPEQRAEAEPLVASTRDPQRLNAQIEFILSIQGKMADALRLPEAEFQAWWRSVQSSLTEEHALAKWVIPALAVIQPNLQQLRIERTLLTAGADVLRHGPAQAGRYRDPATGGALQYVPTASGFELRSPYLVKGKPVSMAFER